MKDLIVITGPTAVGKSDLAVKLAKQINGEIISADSMQVYVGMDIGSAKVTAEEMDGVPHHLIDILEPTEPFDVTIFKAKATEAINDIINRGKTPIICGGTGFYIQSILYDIDFTDDALDYSIRDKYQKIADENGAQYLHELLKEKDIVSYEKIPANNVKRVIRALEYFDVTGTPISEHNATEKSKEMAYNTALFVLTDDRTALYTRINKRVDKMVDAGLVEEVKALIDKGVTRDMTSMQGIGYREIYDCLLDNNISLNTAVDAIKQNSRHYAKRQITWYRSREGVTWVDRQNFRNDDEILSFMKEELKIKNII